MQLCLLNAIFLGGYINCYILYCNYCYLAALLRCRCSHCNVKIVYLRVLKLHYTFICDHKSVVYCCHKSIRHFIICYVSVIIVLLYIHVVYKLPCTCRACSDADGTTDADGIMLLKVLIVMKIMLILEMMIV